MSELQSPFERLRTRLAGLEPGAPPIDLTVGAPRHAPPAFVADVLAANADMFGPYPAITGTPELQDAAHDWLDARYGLDGMLRDKGALLATCGSREGLFFAAVTARDLIGKPDPVILFANPYYQVYAAAAEALRIEGVPLAARAADTVLPDLDRLDPALLDRAIAYYVAAPSNPEGNCASLADWHTLLDLAEKHDFYLFADECYSEIYRERMGPPAGALTAAKSRPEGLRRLIAFNSLSKRSNLAGLRVGFVAGDRATMGAMKDFRNQAAPQVPVALQAVAAAALRDEAHVTENRRLYDEKFAAAEAALAPTFGTVTPHGGFCLWLHVGGDDAAFVADLWQSVGVKALPGSYLAAGAPGRPNPGAGRIRIALVSGFGETEEAINRLRAFLERRDPLARAS